jgi:hypothetical protein
LVRSGNDGAADEHGDERRDDEGSEYGQADMASNVP